MTGKALIVRETGTRTETESLGESQGAGTTPVLTSLGMTDGMIGTGRDMAGRTGGMSGMDGLIGITSGALLVGGSKKVPRMSGCARRLPVLALLTCNLFLSRSEKPLESRHAIPLTTPGYSRTDSTASLAQSINLVLVPQDISKPDPPPLEAVETEPEPEQEQVPEKSLEEQLEERRRKRREILEKFSGVQSGVSSIGTGASTAGTSSR